MNYLDKIGENKEVNLPERQALVAKLLASKQFRRAPKLRDLLEYLGRRTVPAGSDDLHEVEIGHALYGRPADYNTNDDSIARVEIRNLRKKLDQYFSGEGKSEPVVVTIPKGNYRLEFSRRRKAKTKSDNPHRMVWLFAAVLIGALASAPLWFMLGSQSRPVEPALDASPPLPMWSDLFENDRNTYLVVADAQWAEAQFIFGTDYSLSDYLSSAQPADSLPEGWNGFEDQIRHIFSQQFTSVADVQLACRIVHLQGIREDRFFVRFARNMNMRDFKGSNLILLGSRRANPWVELFADLLTFQFDFDPALGRPLFRNPDPREGEKPRYIAGGPEGTSDEIYARAAFLPNLSRDGYVVIIDGTLMEGTEAVGELLTSPAVWPVAVRELGLESDGNLQFFEILIQSSAMAGSSGSARIVAHRTIDADGSLRPPEP